MANANSGKYDHLIWAGLGLLGGLAYADHRATVAKQSRAERDDPDGTATVSEEIAELLENWDCPGDCTEEQMVEELASYLEEASDWEIETWPRTSYGTPDILVGDLLALELKMNPNKAERDRCVGQCAGYSRQWVTWIVLFDASASRVGALQDLLADKGLEQIAVWNF